MEFYKILRKIPIFRNHSVIVEPLTGGLTNANFRIDDGANKYVARFGFKTNKHLGLNRTNEIYNYRIAAQLGIGPKVVKYYPEYNMLLVEYIDGKVINPKIAKDPKIIVKIAKLIKKMHEGPKFKGLFNPFTINNKYFGLVRKNESWIPKNAQNLLQDLKTLKSRFQKMELNYSCHLDLFTPNIVKNKDKIHFLDWEYSAKSDYRFDLATLSSMADFEPKHDRLLIRAYGRKNLSLEQLNLAKAIMLIREIGWDLVQVKFAKIDFNYKQYTLDNLKKYYKVLKQIHLN